VGSSAVSSALPQREATYEITRRGKAYFRKAEARSKKTLIQAIGSALEIITAQDAAGWFADDGYPYMHS